MKMGCFLGIDLGTSYLKAGIFDRQGNLLGLGRVPTGGVTPAPGRSEISVAEFWRRLRVAIGDALGGAAVTPDALGGVSYASQANTFVLLDAHGVELGPLVVWNDRRADPCAEELLAFGRTEAFRRTSGLWEVIPELASVKWAWCARQEPRLWSRVARALTISDYLTHALTGRFAGDAATAALTGLYDLVHRRWSEPALAAFGLDASLLAEPLPPGTRCGETSDRARGLLGLPPGIPFAVGTLDHHAAAIGSGVTAPSTASVSTGTVLAALALSPRIEPGPSRIHGPHAAGGLYYTLAFDPAGLGQLEDYRRHEAPAMTVADLLECAAGQGGNGQGAAVRRLLETLAECQSALLRRIATEPIREVAATGGGVRSPLLLQMQADAFGVPVTVERCGESASLGAALLAAVAAGAFPDLAAASAAMVRPETAASPRRAERK